MTTSYRFPKFVNSSRIAAKLLPLTHTTDGYYIREIISSGQLTARPCPIFKNEPLLYLFYGRPAFRVAATKQATALRAFALVSLILRSETLPSPKRIFPFDSGAMHRGLYDDFLHPGMTLCNFAVEPTLKSAQNIVTLFFGDNKSYYLGKCARGNVFPALEMEAQCYYALLQASHQMPVDDRKGSIEVQLGASLMLNDSNVRAVIMPLDFCDDDDLVNFVVDELGAKILTYECYHAQPSEDARSILTEARKYFESEGLFA